MSSPPHDRPEPAAPELDGLRVLIVEDSWLVGTALKRLLEMAGADVTGPVATTADAAPSISERTIDVALVDISLRDGEQSYDLIDQLHDQGIRIVIVSGHADVEVKQEKVAAILMKPVEPRALLNSLRPQ
jgi:DNA-binding NtrC family response regulator